MNLRINKIFIFDCGAAITKLWVESLEKFESNKNILFETLTADFEPEYFLQQLSAMMKSEYYFGLYEVKPSSARKINSEKPSPKTSEEDVNGQVQEVLDGVLSVVATKPLKNSKEYVN